MARKFRFEQAQQEAAAKPKPKPGDGSDDFWAAFCDNGGLVRTCMCGRTVFADSERAGDWEEGELEDLRAKATAQPDKYVAIGEDGVSQCSIGIVWGCPCGMAGRYENFLIEYEQEILTYYRRTIPERKKRADADMRLLESVELT